MHITEESDSQVKLSLPSFSCDGELGKHIPEPLPNRHFAWLCSGKAGSGKTSLVMSLLCGKGEARVYRKVFDHVYIIVPRASLSSLKKDAFVDHNQSRIYHELSGDILHEIKESCKKLRDSFPDSKCLILIDDMAVYLKEKTVQKALADIICNRRHYGISLFLCVQSYMFVPLTLRKQLTHISMWKPTNKREFQSVFEELVYLDKDSADKLAKFVFREPYDHLFLDVNRSHFARNFNTLTLED
jgi:hypothetical protein